MTVINPTLNQCVSIPQFPTAGSSPQRERSMTLCRRTTVNWASRRATWSTSSARWMRTGLRVPFTARSATSPSTTWKSSYPSPRCWRRFVPCAQPCMWQTSLPYRYNCSTLGCCQTGGRHHRPSTTEVSTLRRCGAIKVHVALNSQLVSELELFWKRHVSELTIQTEPSLLWTFSVISLYGATTTDGQHTPRRAELVQSRVEGRDCTCWCVFYWRLWSTSSYLSPQSIVWDLVLDCSRSAWVCRQPTSTIPWSFSVSGGWWGETCYWTLGPKTGLCRQPTRRSAVRSLAFRGDGIMLLLDLFFSCRIACLVCS